MIKCILTILLSLFIVFLFGQSSGEVIYQMEKQLNYEGKQIPPDILKNLPKKTDAQYRLLFSPDAYVFKAMDNQKKPETISMRKGGRMHRFSGRGKKDYVRYQDLSTQSIQEKKSIFDKPFIVEVPFEKLKWKLLPDKQKVGQYTAYKAELVDTTQRVVAWFAPEIPIQSGPMEFGQLPGLILYLDIDDGTTVYSATNIEFRPLTSEEMERPTGAKTISAQRYEELMEERIEEMKARFKRH